MTNYEVYKQMWDELKGVKIKDVSKELQDGNKSNIRTKN